MPDSKKDKVWEKAKPVRGKNDNVWRIDAMGNVIRNASHGAKGKYGWEIDHKHPKSKGGSDNIRNLQPLQWEENRAKGDKIQKSKKK